MCQSSGDKELMLIGSVGTQASCLEVEWMNKLRCLAGQQNNAYGEMGM